MQIPEHIKTSQVLKIAGLAVVGIIIIAFLVRITSSSFSAIFNTSDAASDKSAWSEPAAYGGYAGDYDEVALSARNVADSGIIPPQPNTVPGDDAEAYEVTEYNASIETRDKTETCAIFENLKPKDYIIFESATQSDDGCYFRFKAKNENVDEVLNIIDELNPKDFSESTYTIKQVINDYTSEVEILEKKLASIESTLDDAVSAYDDITTVATRTQNAEALAKIIDSKIGIIERLTQQKININSQLDRLARSKAEQLDRLIYTSFYVNITENKFVDAQNLKDSWKLAIKQFVRDINSAIQDVSVNLIAALFSALQYVIYFFILLFVAKYGYRITKQVWRK